MPGTHAGIGSQPKNLNYVCLAHGSQIQNNFQNKQQLDAFLTTINSSSAFLSDVELFNLFGDSKMDRYLKFFFEQREA